MTLHQNTIQNLLASRLVVIGARKTKTREIETGVAEIDNALGGSLYPS
jgi:hypothetical protein